MIRFKRMKLMKYLMSIILYLALVCLLPSMVLGAISFTDGAWFTTFDCPEWAQGEDISCNGLEPHGDWLAYDQADQIVSGANNSSGAGGNGFRHWKGDGTNENGGGVSVYFPSPQKQFWMRWYLRYEEGFLWSFLGYDKTLYIDTATPHVSVIPEFYSDKYVLIAQGTSDYYQVTSDYGWDQIQGGSVGDGKFHCFEIYLKMDTNSTNGIGRLWIDGVLRVENTSVDWSAGHAAAREGWRHIAIGSNQNAPANGRNMYVDYDDVAIYQTAPPNRDADGNAFIGMLEAGGDGGGDDPPTLPNDPSIPIDVLFEDPIEAEGFIERGWYDFTDPVLTSAQSVPGSSRAIEYRFLENGTKPVSGSAMRRKFTESDSVYVSYYVKYSSNWVGSQRNFHPHEFHFLTNKDGDWSGLSYTHLTTYVEQNALRPRLIIQDGRNIDENQIGENLVDHTENRSIGGCNGDSDGYGTGSCYLDENGVYQNGKQWPVDSPAITTGAWHKVEAFFKLNSVINNQGVADGVVQYWLDGNLLIDHHDVMLRTALNADMKFNQFIIAPWMSYGSPIEQTFWLDHIVVGKASEYASPTCTDGIQNGGETGIDCGGVCDPCVDSDNGASGESDNNSGSGGNSGCFIGIVTSGFEF